MTGGPSAPPRTVAQPAVAGDRHEPSSGGRIRHYRRSEAVIFLKTREEFGGLSNMAAGFPLRVNGTQIRTSEALYQMCRFPHLPDVQRDILEQRSPMTAKMKSKPHRADSRPDWDQVRIRVMRWCLRVKLAQHWETFASLLESTGDRPIVEESRRDDFWGAKPTGDHLLVGMNILGRLLMELRDKAREGGPGAFRLVPPPQLENFRLLDDPVETVVGSEALAAGDMLEQESGDRESPPDVSWPASQTPTAVQTSNTGWTSCDGGLIAYIRSLVREHPVTRPEIDAALGPLLPVSLSESEKKKRIASRLRSLRRAGWIVFHKADRRWKPGNRRVLPSPGDAGSDRDQVARHG